MRREQYSAFSVQCSDLGKTLLLLLMCLLTLETAMGAAADPVVQKADSLEQSGRFKEAAEILTTGISNASTNSSERKTLEFELDRLDRIKRDFPYSKDDLFK